MLYYNFQLRDYGRKNMSKFLKIALMVMLAAACSKFDKRSDVSIVNGDTEKAAYKVELAQTDDEMRTGLMNREKLDENSGMLFNLGKFNVPTAMWMKDTKIALDMLFIDKDGTVFWIYENAEPESTKLIVAPFPAFAVLEINAGDVKKHNIKIGDTVKHEWFKAETQADEPKIAPAEEPVEKKAEVIEDNTEVIENNAEAIEDNTEATETPEPKTGENTESEEVKNITLD